MSFTPIAAITSLLVERRWEQVGTGPAGTLWQKGEAESPIPNSLRVGSAAWRATISAIASVERTSTYELVDRLNRYLLDDPVPSPKRASFSASRSELDLHLEGPGVRLEHETSAYDYGRFVATMADTIKELVKESAGIARHTRELQVVGGAAEGSVQVLFREPTTTIDAQDALTDEPMEAAERRAMLTLAQIMNASEEAASSPSVDSPLDSQLDLSPSVRQSIAKLAKIMYQAGWITRGTLSSPGQELVPVAISLAGCYRLERSASAQKTATTSETYHGVLDGWSWSTATAQFITDTARTIRAAVPMILQTDVARLVGFPDQRCTATFEVTERQAPNGGAISRTYSVAAITRDIELDVWHEDDDVTEEDARITNMPFGDD